MPNRAYDPTYFCKSQFLFIISWTWHNNTRVYNFITDLYIKVVYFQNKITTTHICILLLFVSTPHSMAAIFIEFNLNDCITQRFIFTCKKAYAGCSSYGTLAE